MPPGELIAPSFATLCCRYFLYASPDNDPKTTRQATVIPRPLKILLRGSRRNLSILSMTPHLSIAARKDA